MEKVIQREIEHLCRKKFAKRRLEQKRKKLYKEKFERRTDLPSLLPTGAGIVYVDKHFDPVYCKRNARFLARSIWHKMQSDPFAYRPKPALLRQFPKAGGGVRPIMEFTIPDAAVSKIVFRNVSARNLKNQSGNSFAYRSDLTVFDALLKLRSSLDRPKVFISQYDFAKYFDSIPHKWLRQLMSDREIFTSTPLERNVVEQFMNHTYATTSDYLLGNFETRVQGTPQGSSISLLLANLANAPLDKKLESLNGQFVRFADDVVNITYSYEDALRIESAFLDHCRESGIALNIEKSPGVFVLSPVKQELRQEKSFTYLGYDISREGLGLSEKAERKLKAKVSRLINIYLHREPRAKRFNHRRSGHGFDWDLMGFVYELRNIIYGGVTEEQIESFLTYGKRLPVMKGYMSFYCLMDSSDRLKAIDGWLVDTLHKSLNIRKQLLNSLKHKYYVPSRDEIIQGKWHLYTSNNGKTFDARLPSLIRGWRAARKYYFTYGLEGVEQPPYIDYF